MRKLSFTLCIAAALLTLGCNREKRVAIVNFPDCDKDTKAEWAGQNMCAQELDSSHYDNPAVKVSMQHCKGIHITHGKDTRLDLLLRHENSSESCPVNPFKNSFPFDSGNVQKTDFDTGAVTDKNAIGCGYEIHLQEKHNLGKCDPHIDIEQ